MSDKHRTQNDSPLTPFPSSIWLLKSNRRAHFKCLGRRTFISNRKSDDCAPTAAFESLPTAANFLGQTRL